MPMSLLLVLHLLVLASVFIVAASGTCLNYGHSCWGAHGKRSGSGSGNGSGRDEVSLDNWLISRLLSEGRRAPGLLPAGMTHSDRSWSSLPAHLAGPHKINLEAVRWLTRGRLPVRLFQENNSRSLREREGEGEGEGEALPLSTTNEQEMNELAVGPGPVSASDLRSAPSQSQIKDQELVLLEQAPKIIKILEQP